MLISGDDLNPEDLLPMANGFIQRRAVTRVATMMSGGWKAYIGDDYFYMPEYVKDSEDVECWWQLGRERKT